MGVNGLWTVVQPCARPTNLATLNRKRLAVDASIWIYQFLKAVRDKEGNALRNSHVVGFFRRICKLLWFGILPVFVFDGGAPVLKRQTILNRKQRREGRREDAVRTAGKLLAVQMQRIVEEEEDKRRRNRDRVAAREEEMQEEIPDPSQFVYVAEESMTQNERAQNRRFRKQDAYHLPDLDGGGIAAMGKPDDPRIMSVEELEEYARQFHAGEDINLYDFSKIDFDGEFFKSLPPPDRYNILNAARLRSRLRLGLSKDQLDDMFPDRMAFSRFQIERVKERNHLTQRLMLEVGMTGTDLTLGVNGRIAGEKNREYILVKNDGVEGGWALGVVSKEKDVGEAHKPIDVDAIQVQYQSKDNDEEDEDTDFEDVPIEGLNRLPKPSSAALVRMEGDGAWERTRPNSLAMHGGKPSTADNEGSLFIEDNVGDVNELLSTQNDGGLHPEEEDDLNRAIALSLQNQHGIGLETETEGVLEDVPFEESNWKQKSVETAKRIVGTGGSMIAHIVNNRANAAVPRRQEKEVAADSDSEDDMQAIMARSRRMKKPQPAPILENKKNPFGGPLPFPKLDWGSSIFAKKPPQKSTDTDKGDVAEPEDVEDETAGGFERGPEKDGPKPLPPWLTDDSDIRDSLKKQQEAEREINAEDRLAAEEEERLRRREMQDRLIEIESSSDDDDEEIQIIEIPSPTDNSKESPPIFADNGDTEAKAAHSDIEPSGSHQIDATEATSEPEFIDIQVPVEVSGEMQSSNDEKQSSASPEPEFEDVPVVSHMEATPKSLPLTFESDHTMNAPVSNEIRPDVDIDDALFEDDEDEFSDPGDEELLAQMAEEAEEHARFASELNHKSAEQNREDYEKELRALRNQQKKDRRDADEVTQVMITECQALLRLFGIPYITAPMEAEAQCAELVHLGLVDGIVTDDSDIFLFGGTRVYKNMFNGNKFVECYLGADIEKELSLSREQLISLAQLLGSDYTDGLPGVGPVTAVEILSEFPGKNGLQDFHKWWQDVQSQTRPKEADAPSTFRRKFRKSQAAKLFLPPGFPSPAVYDAYLQPEVDDNAEAFQWGVPDVEGLRQFLMATIGWSKERTDEVLVPVIKDMNQRDREGTQANITRFFGGGVGVGAKEAFAPRQRGQGSKRMAAAVDRLRANVTGESSATAAQADVTGKRKRAARREAVEGEERDAGDGEGQAESADQADEVPRNKGRGRGKKRSKV